MIKRNPSLLKSNRMVVTSDALKEVPVRGTPNGEIYTRPIDGSLTEEGFPTNGKKGRPLFGNYKGTLHTIGVTSKGRILIEPPPGPVSIKPAEPLEVTANIKHPLDISSTPPVEVANWPKEIEVKPHAPKQYKIRPINVSLESDDFLIIPGKTRVKEIHFQILDIWNTPTEELFSLQPSLTGPIRSDHFDMVLPDGFVQISNLIVKFTCKLSLRIGGWYIEN